MDAQNIVGRKVVKTFLDQQKLKGRSLQNQEKSSRMPRPRNEEEKTRITKLRTTTLFYKIILHVQFLLILDRVFSRIYAFMFSGLG